MANAKHTPGPWAFEKTGQEAGYIGFPDGSGFYAAINEDDLRVIATAPELLHALLCLTEWVEDHAIKPSEIPELASARAAIQKAEAA